MNNPLLKPKSSVLFKESGIMVFQGEPMYRHICSAPL